MVYIFSSFLLNHSIMTKFNAILATLFIGSVAFTACKNDPKTTATTAPKGLDTLQMAPILSADGAATYTVTDGTVNWLGSDATKSQHNGTIKVKSGDFKVKEGQILSGKVILDMTSLTDLDLTDAGKKERLEAHLKAPDFFGVNQYPTAEFTIEEVLPSKMPEFNAVVVGTLKMKDKTGSVNIPVKMTIENNEINVQSAAFILNRTQWGVNFGSSLVEKIKDRMIDDNVTLNISLKAKAQ
jgi:polyisoprenoid-binding protein YceI